MSTSTPRKPKPPRGKKRASEPKRVPGTKRARTREKLLSAAVALFAEKGIFATSLDEIAARAGLTKGAIYGNFADKDDLVFAVAVERMSTPTGAVFKPGLPLKEQMRLLADGLLGMGPATMERLPLTNEFFAYALLRPNVFARVAAMQRQTLDAAEAHVRETLDARELKLPPREFVVLINALFMGLMHQRAVHPEVVTDEMVRRALEALVD